MLTKLTVESCEMRKTQTGVGRPLVDAGTSVLAGSGLTAVWDFMDKDSARQASNPMFESLSFDEEEQ